MSGLDQFLESYGLAAACALMLVKAVGVPIPIPGDVVLLATAARAAEGKVVLWLAFVSLLVAITAGGMAQFLLARGPGRDAVIRYGARLGLTTDRLDRVADKMRRGGPLGIGVGVLTPGVRTAVIPACGLAGMPVPVFLSGLLLGSAIDLALHFAIGLVGSSVLSAIVAPSPLSVIAVLALLGLAGWFVLARRRRASAASAYAAWSQATCPVCLALGAASPAEPEPAIRWERAR